jgi:hypothetical protein
MQLLASARPHRKSPSGAAPAILAIEVKWFSPVQPVAKGMSGSKRYRALPRAGEAK